MISKLILSGCFILKDSDSKILLLYRKSHQWYETPGGKVDPTDKDLEAAAIRELHEELGSDIKVSPLEYFGVVEVELPDGRMAEINKFITRIISGTPKVNEPEIFSKVEYIPIDELEKHPLSRDMKLFLPKFREYLKNK